MIADAVDDDSKNVGGGGGGDTMELTINTATPTHTPPTTLMLSDRKAMNAE